jgi:hypothetical protein
MITGIKHTIGSILFFVLTLSLTAQDKIEREYGIKREEVPQKALKWFNEAFQDPGKVNWYFEESSGKGSYEAKFRLDGSTYSVEFDTSGYIEDIEIDISWKKIPAETRKNLEAFFESNYSRHKLMKIQRQYTGLPEVLLEFILNESLDGVTVKYEIEYHGKTETENELWEGLFDADGNAEQIRKIILAPTNNMEF